MNNKRETLMFLFFDVYLYFFKREKSTKSLSIF